MDSTATTNNGDGTVRKVHRIGLCVLSAVCVTLQAM